VTLKQTLYGNKMTGKKIGEEESGNKQELEFATGSLYAPFVEGLAGGIDTRGTHRYQKIVLAFERGFISEEPAEQRYVSQHGDFSFVLDRFKGQGSDGHQSLRLR
jgi:hypothetical protein